MPISDIVNVQITRETAAVSQRGFGIMMVLGVHKKFNERIRYYQNADDVLLDGFSSNDPEYLAVNAAFSQNPRPVFVAIGRRSVDSVNIEIVDAVDGNDYTVVINDEEFTHTAGPGDSVEDIAAALVGLINAGDEPVTATDNNDGTLTIDADVANEAYTINVMGDMEIDALIASDTIANDLTAVNESDDDWYGVVITSRVEQDVLDTAAWVESRVKLFGTASNDVDLKNPGSTGDIASQLKDLNYARTFSLYHDQTDELYPEAAWFGKQLPTDPGSTTWAFKTLAGVPVVNLNSNERLAILNKNASTYEERAGVSITFEGKIAEGDYIDVIRGVDWLTARIQERIFFRLCNNLKIPYTDGGVAIIESELRAQLNDAIARNVIAADPEPVITVPLVRDVNPNDRANRILPDVNFTATLAGAIHRVEINGTVSI